MREYKRKTICNALTKLCERVIAVNEGTADLPYPQRIKKVIVFGSFINSTKETVHDGDIYIEVDENRDKWRDFAQKYGNRNGNYIDYLFTAQHKLNKYLKTSPALSFQNDEETFEKIVKSDTHIFLIDDGKLLKTTYDDIAKYENPENGFSKKKADKAKKNISDCWKMTNSPVSSIKDKSLTPGYCAEELRNEIRSIIPESYFEKDFCTNIVLIEDLDDEEIIQVNLSLVDKVILVPKDFFEKCIYTKDLYAYARKRQAVGVKATIQTLSDVICNNDIDGLVDLIIESNLQAAYEYMPDDWASAFSKEYKQHYCDKYEYRRGNCEKKYLKSTIFDYATRMLLEENCNDSKNEIQYGEMRNHLKYLYKENKKQLAQYMVSAFDEMISGQKIITFKCRESYSKKCEKHIYLTREQINDDVMLFNLPFDEIEIRI